MRGKFITFEGGEGSGKSTQARALANRLAAAGVQALITREPGGSEFAEAARGILLDPKTAPKQPLAAALLFYAARADHLAETIEPALAAGRWVLCDRFSDSTRVYQGAAGGVGDSDIEALERMVVGARQPDLTLVLDLDPAIGLARANARRELGAAASQADTYEARQLSFHQRLREGFLELAKVESHRMVVLDADKTAEQVAEAVWSVVAERFGVA
ncbi:MAG: dTMP kinase [Proteobacteria bacterium]|nr:dTMP kinase [Pseudomonadota bacterium]